jgi:hypothetical protein
MRGFLALYLEALAWLRRDKVFTPMILVGVCISLFAGVASQWTIEEFSKVLFDIGFAGFRLTGGAVAILWGSRVIHDALHDRSLDPRLAAPISRWVWYLARFCSLATVVTMMGVVFALCWQGIMIFHGFGTMTELHVWSFTLLVCEWIILAGLAMTVATYTGFGISLFATALLWLSGLLAPLVAATKGADVTGFQQILVDGIADIWNFQRFNLVDQLGTSGGDLNIADMQFRVAWAGALLATTLVAGIWRFSERDLG